MNKKSIKNHLSSKNLDKRSRTYIYRQDYRDYSQPVIGLEKAENRYSLKKMYYLGITY